MVYRGKPSLGCANCRKRKIRVSNASDPVALLMLPVSAMEKDLLASNVRGSARSVLATEINWI